jgi:5-methylcytosine-specific restriction endonuclease McrA
MAKTQPTLFDCLRQESTANRSAGVVCQQCKNLFVPKRIARSTYCSHACAFQARRDAATETCQHCRKGFVPKAFDRRTYCSRDCAFAAKRERAQIKQQEAEADRPVCFICGGRLPKGKHVLCGEECKKEQARRKASADYHNRIKIQKGVTTRTDCIVCCGVIPEGIRHGRRMYCSNRCHEKAYRKTNRATVNAANRRRKHMIKAATVERVSPVKVFDRDNWTCWICATPTDPNAGVGTAQYPTLDHVIPLSKGGEHSYANVRCACHLCNSRKRDIIIAA